MERRVCRNTLVLFVTGSSPDRLIGLLPYGNHVDLSRLLSHINIEGCGWRLDASGCLGGCQREIEVFFFCPSAKLYPTRSKA